MKQVRAPHPARRALGMLRLDDAITSADVVEHEIAVWVNDFIRKGFGHGLEIAAGLCVIVERANLRACFGRSVVGLVTDRATEFLSVGDIGIKVPEDLLALLHKRCINDRMASWRNFGR